MRAFLPRLSPAVTHRPVAAICGVTKVEIRRADYREGGTVACSCWVRQLRGDHASWLDGPAHPANPSCHRHHSARGPRWARHRARRSWGSFGSCRTRLLARLYERAFSTWKTIPKRRAGMRRIRSSHSASIVSAPFSGSSIPGSDCRPGMLYDCRLSPRSSQPSACVSGTHSQYASIPRSRQG